MTLRWGITGAAALLFVVLAVMSLSALGTDVGGPFDGRLTGYDVEDATAYLSALAPGQIALYSGVFRLLDTVFPTLLAIALVFWARHLTMRPWRVGFYLLIALYLVADLAENALVGRMLDAGAGALSPDTVVMAAFFTKIKWATLSACIAGLVVASVRRR